MGNGFTDFVGGVASSASDAFVGIAGGETSTQEDARVAREDAAKAGRQDLKALTQQQQNLQLNGHDPASITQQDNWQNWDQARLASELKPSLKVETINRSGQGWEKLGQKIADSLGDLEGRSRQAAGDGMRGQAAEAGLNAAKPLQEWGRAFGDAVRGTGLKIQEAGVAAEQTKASIQEPAGYDGTRAAVSAMVSPVGGLMDGAAQMREQKEADQQARQVAENVYGKGYQGVDSSTPTFPPPVNPLAPPPPPPGSETPGDPGTGTGSGYSGSGSGSGSSGSGSGSGSSGYSGGSAPAQSSSQWASSSPAGPGIGGGAQPGATPPGAGGPGAGFVGAVPPGAGAGAGAGRGAGGMGGARGAGGGMGAGGKAGGGMGAGGRAGMGGLGAGGAAGGAAGAGAGGRGAGDAGAGAGAGRGGQGGGEDAEHERPSWLEEQEDIWMDDMPKTAPPVFGE